AEVALGDPRRPGPIVQHHRRLARDRIDEHRQRLDLALELDVLIDRLDRRDPDTVVAAAAGEEPVEPAHAGTLSLFLCMPPLPARGARLSNERWSWSWAAFEIPPRTGENTCRMNASAKPRASRATRSRPTICHTSASRARRLDKGP